jgi:hypothetical protein
MIFYVIDRYRVPIMPYVCVMAALTVEALYGRLTAATRVPFRPGGQEIRQSVLSSGVERASEGRCAVGPRANGGRR